MSLLFIGYFSVYLPLLLQQTKALVTGMVSLLAWCFRILIAVDESVLRHRYVNIVLDGLDTVANVMLNGILLVSTRNMFQRFVIDVTDILKVRLNYCSNSSV